MKIQTKEQKLVLIKWIDWPMIFWPYKELIFPIGWCCFYYFVRNSLVALLEALCCRIFSLDSWISVFFWHFFFVVVRSLTKPFFCLIGDHYWSSHWFSNKQHYLSLCLSQSGSCAWLSPFLLCADCCVCVPLYVHVKMCR